MWNVIIIDTGADFLDIWKLWFPQYWSLLSIFSSMLTLDCVIIEQKRKTLCYVDYDQTPGEEDVMQNAASLTWPGTVAASSFQLESESESKHCNRESVTYEDDDPPSSSRAADPLIVRGKCYNYQFDINHAPAPGNWMHTAMSTQYVVMAALWKRAGHYIFALWFLRSIYLLSSLFSSPNLSRRRLDVCHTSTHGVAVVWI